MSFRAGQACELALATPEKSAIAVVTGGRSGIGKAVAIAIASFPFIDRVVAVSRSIKDHDFVGYDKIITLEADVATDVGRQRVLDKVRSMCNSNHNTKKHLRFLIHSAGTIEPIKSVLDVQANELRQAMIVNCEAPLLLTTALYPFMVNPNNVDGVSGRVLHVSSGAAHGAPPVGWSVYGVTKAAFFQSFRALEREFRESQGGKVVVGSFKPGIVDTPMQGVIRGSSNESMPMVQAFQQMKEKADNMTTSSPGDNSMNATVARCPPEGALDTPENVANFVEYLLVGMTDEEFANKDDPNEHDIRDSKHHTMWIP